MSNSNLSNIEKLIDQAKRFQVDDEIFNRNQHMLVHHGVVIGSELPIKPIVKAAVLTMFLNFVAGESCVDLGMYLEDFLK